MPRRSSGSRTAASTSSTSTSAPASTRRELPVVLGSEAAGIVERVGQDVTEVAPGDRVAYAMVRGSYAEYAVVPAAQLVKIPDGVDLVDGGRGHAPGHDGALPDALDVSARGRRQPVSSTPPPAAPAGSSSRWRSSAARACSARCRPRRRRARSRGLGADEAIIYTRQDFEAEVKRLTDGRGVDVVYDSVGKTTFDKSLNVAPRRAARWRSSASRAARCRRSIRPSSTARLAVPDAAEPRASSRRSR